MAYKQNSPFSRFSYESPLNSFDSLVAKLEKEGKSHEAATKIAGSVANAKMHGAGSGPTAKQKARHGMSRESSELADMPVVDIEKGDAEGDDSSPLNQGVVKSAKAVARATKGAADSFGKDYAEKRREDVKNKKDKNAGKLPSDQGYNARSGEKKEGEGSGKPSKEFKGTGRPAPKDGVSRKSSSPLNQNQDERSGQGEARRQKRLDWQNNDAVSISDEAAKFLNMKKGGFYSVAAIKNKLRTNTSNVKAARKLIMQNEKNVSLLNRNSSSPVHRDGSMKGDQSKTKSDYANFKDTDPGYHGHDGESHGDQSATRRDYVDVKKIISNPK